MQCGAVFDGVVEVPGVGILTLGAVPHRYGAVEVFFDSRIASLLGAVADVLWCYGVTVWTA